jgi:hypothetical protein
MMNPKSNEHATDVATTPPAYDSSASAADNPKPIKELSADEQMALYEKELKENDWGHQPC